MSSESCQIPYSILTHVIQLACLVGCCCSVWNVVIDQYYPVVYTVKVLSGKASTYKRGFRHFVYISEGSCNDIQQYKLSETATVILFRGGYLRLKTVCCKTLVASLQWKHTACLITSSSQAFTDYLSLVFSWEKCQWMPSVINDLLGRSRLRHIHQRISSADELTTSH